MNLFEELKDILVSNYKISETEIKLNSKIQEDLALDSIDVMQLILYIEEKYDIKLDEIELFKFKTVGDVVKYIEILINDK